MHNPKSKIQNSKFKIKKGDTVLLLAGKDKNKTGRVLKVDRKRGRVVVEKVNLAKKHLKPSQQYPQGGIIDLPRPLSISNVMIICPHCQKSTRLSMKITADKKQKRLRICQKCGQNIEN